MSSSPNEITVNRKNLKTNTDTKTFEVDSNTKVEGNIRAKARVTVQFVTGEGGSCRAIHIIVR